jgi:hypothetical protein
VEILQIYCISKGLLTKRDLQNKPGESMCEKKFESVNKVLFIFFPIPDSPKGARDVAMRYAKFP